MFNRCRYSKRKNDDDECELLAGENHRTGRKKCASDDDDDDGANSDDKPFKLQRTIGVLAGSSIVVGSMIGSGIFIVPANVLRHCAGSVELTLYVWVAAGVVAMLTALCYCELATMIPVSGNAAAYFKLIYGDAVCFVFLWLAMFIVNAQGLAVQTVALGDYISNAMKSYLFGGCPSPKSLSKLLGLSVLMLALAINMRNVKFALKIQMWFTIGKVLALLLISFFGLVALVSDSSILASNLMTIEPTASPPQHTVNERSFAKNLSSFCMAIFQALWAYDGFDNITFVTEEVKNPRKTLPKIIVSSILSVMTLYIFVNISYFSVLTSKEMLTSEAVAVSFALKIHPWLSTVVTSGVCLSLIGSINLTFLACGRLPFVAARMGFMPQILAMADVRRYSPTPALLFLTLATVLMMLPSGLTALLEGTLFTTWIFRAMCCVGVLVLRRQRPRAARPYKMWITTAWLASACVVTLVAASLVLEPRWIYLLTLVLALLALALHRAIRRGRFSFRKVGRFTVVAQKLLLCAPTDTCDS